jgi:hypothetical protein
LDAARMACGVLPTRISSASSACRREARKSRPTSW